nr:uncharacterized protein LOC109731780 isoform X2 [Aegilops tauschii subsp. strangulata]
MNVHLCSDFKEVCFTLMFLQYDLECLISNSQKGKTTLLCFLENLPVEYLDRDKYAIKDIFDGFSRKTWRIFFADSLVLSWLFYSDFPCICYLVTIYCSLAIVQLLTLWSRSMNRSKASHQL